MSTQATLTADWNGYALHLPNGTTIRLYANDKRMAIWEANRLGYAVQS